MVEGTFHESERKTGEGSPLEPGHSTSATILHRSSCCFFVHRYGQREHSMKVKGKQGRISIGARPLDQQGRISIGARPLDQRVHSAPIELLLLCSSVFLLLFFAGRAFCSRVQKSNAPDPLGRGVGCCPPDKPRRAGKARACCRPRPPSLTATGAAAVHLGSWFVLCCVCWTAVCSGKSRVRVT
jgi:hypothetical protein